VADAAFGDSRDFREGISALGLPYSVGISSNTCVWPTGAAPATPKPTGRRGRPPSYERDPRGKQPIRVDKYAEKLWRSGKFKALAWRRGTKGPLRGKFCAVRIRSAERRTKNRKASEPQWLLIERDLTRDSGFKYYLSTVSERTPLKKLVRVTKVRWHIERDYQDMKQNLGFDRYEGRTWGGFHRHLAMVALMHAFISLHREGFSPDLIEEPVDMGRLSPCPNCGAHALGGALPHLSEAV
jgi:SRSO17 transposase